MARSAALIEALCCPASSMSNWRLVGAFWPEAATAQKTNTQILLIFVISPRTCLEMRSHEDAQVCPRTLWRRRNQILRTLTLCGGLSGGDSNVFPAIPIVGRAKGEGASASIVIAEPKSLLWILDAVAVWGETGCWQHECELGITDISQRPAIFSQHSRCSGLISAKDVKHANSGSATTTIDNAIETNCAALRTIFESTAILNRLNSVAFLEGAHSRLKKEVSQGSSRPHTPDRPSTRTHCQSPIAMPARLSAA